MHYLHQEIEEKWQKFWAENQTFAAQTTSQKPKYYVLDMFPYPSGAGLHVGHPLGYIASDIYARYKRHKGYNVLHPMGYDSFGLPAEQYAIQTGQHPAVTTRQNIARYREQLDRMGFSFDWSREVRTSDPQYYRWTQWIFLQLFQSYYCKDCDAARPITELVECFEQEGNLRINAVCDADTPQFDATAWKEMNHKEQQNILLKYRLTYLAEAHVNWCPALGTVLANDEVVNGVSERGGHPVERKLMTQWMMRITAYAERLLHGITEHGEKIDWPEPLKEMQRNWIGKSIGASVNFQTENGQNIEVFTTRPDTIYGVSFLTLAPEHELVESLLTEEQRAEAENYIRISSLKSERERMSDTKTISGAFTGSYALHPLTGEKLPIWISDFVLASYGTGAVMSVPAGDERDHAFAKNFQLEIPAIFQDFHTQEAAFTEKGNLKYINSQILDGLDYEEGRARILQEIEQKNIGKLQTNYRLRDAVFSRQRYWGEPIPVYFKDEIPVAISAEFLPLTLPEVDEYLPTSDGDPPLGRAKTWAWDTVNNQVVSNDKIDGDKVFPLELNTMPGWAGSSWYFLRYMDPDNSNAIASDEALQYWKNVDLYIGGSEHATGHLLYARFWTKFLKDRNIIPIDEPFQKLINQGMILGESAFAYRINGTNQFVGIAQKDNFVTDAIHVDVALVGKSNELDIEGFKTWRDDLKDSEFELVEDKYIVGREVEKMSKSKYNVVNPDDICEEFGADTLRMYEMFLGPLEQTKPWNTNGLSGVYGFLKKLWRLYHNADGVNISDAPATAAEQKILHQTIKKVTEDIESFSFNTAVSAFMIAVNELQKLQCNKREILTPLAILISPYAPHIAEELWQKCGNTESVALEDFPVFDASYLVENTKAYPISFNGKMKFTLELPADLAAADIEKAVMQEEQTKKFLGDAQPKKVIVVPGKIVNIVH
ncbi:MAG: leucine--tRNA ligase [Weeksellaceae bacterium]|nr:leucine--tRNA ligase [Weeksellaceae bacterium]